MNEQNNHPYQKAIDFLIKNDITCNQGTSPYKLLHKLSKLYNIDMNGSKGQIGKEFGYSKNKINRLAKDAILYFCNTDSLLIPNEFKFRKRNNYRHDGNANANRNLWKESNKASKDDASKPFLYTKNTNK